MSTYILPAGKSLADDYQDGAFAVLGGGDLNLAVNPVTGNPALQFEGTGQQLVQTQCGAPGYEFADAILNNRFSQWNFSARFYNVSGDAYVGHQAINGDIRSVFVRLSKSAGTIALWLQDNYDRQRNTLPANFNYNNFELRISYYEQFMAVTVIEYGSDNIPRRSLSYSWRANLFITNTLGTGNFSCGITGSGLIEQRMLTTPLTRPWDIAVMGDSILAGRGTYPAQQRIPDRMMQGFHDEGKHNLKMANFADAGGGVDRIKLALSSVLALQPRIIIWQAGANDPILKNGSFNQDYIDSTKDAILQAQDAGCYFVLCTPSPDNSDPKNIFRDALIDQLPNDQDIVKSRFTVIDLYTPCIIGNGNYNWNPLYSNGGPHPNAVGDEYIGRQLIFPVLKNIVQTLGL